VAPQPARADELPVEEKPPLGDERNGQPEGDLAFDGQSTYTYTGYVLEDGQYVQRSFRFTCEELDIYPSEELGRVCAMVDRVGRDEKRQAEIKRFGRRAWHSPYQPSEAAVQGLDYIFRHDVGRVRACLSYVQGFYQKDAAAADRWTMACYDAYRAFALHQEREPLLRLLAEVEVPLALLGLDTDKQV